MRKHAATIVLVVLAVALGVWLWLDRNRVTEGERKRRENSVFVAWRREELTLVQIMHDGETIVLERDPKAREGSRGTWRMTSPREERADPVAVDHLLSTLEFATVVRRVADAVPLGLDAPRVTGSLRMGGLTMSFAVGGTSPRPEGSSYMKVDAEPAIVVSKELVDALLAPSDVYRDRTVVPYLATELARFEVSRAGGGFVLERIDERSMRVLGAGVLASRASVERLWAALAEMRAEAFPKDADADRLTTAPVLTVVMKPIDGKQPAAEIVIGDACPGHPADVVVLRKAPSRVAACAPKDIVASLGVDPAALVEKHPFTVRMDEIEELRLERSTADGGGGSAPSAIELARKGTGFHQRAPTDRDLSTAEADAATELLTRIANSVATSAAPGGGGAFVSVGKAVVRFGEHEQVVEIGAPHDGRTTLRRVLDDARLEVDAAVARRLLPRETSLRPRVALEDESRRISRVILRCGTDQELVDRGEGFRFASPAGYEADGSISQLVDAVGRGHVDAWVADADDGSFGFTRDACHVVFAFEDGNAPATLWFGAEGEGGVYARLEPRSGVMVVPRAIRELAGQIYVSRGALRTDPSMIESVRVTVDGKAVSRDANALRDAVAALYADKVLALHAKPPGVPDLVIDIALHEGGPARHIRCWPAERSSGALRVCAIDRVDATFAVAGTKLAPFLAAGDGGP